MFKSFTSFKTTSTTTKEGNSDAFKETFKKFDETMEQFGKDMDKAFEGVKPPEGNNSHLHSIEFYGSSYEKALEEANKHSAKGYKLISCTEQSPNLWVAKMKLEVTW